MIWHLSKRPQGARTRTFIAIEIADTVQEWLGDVAASIPAAPDSVKWVRPDLLHLTLLFLGPLSADEVQETVDAVEAAATSVPSFTMALSSLGAFPSTHAPRVIWAGVGDDPARAALTALHGGVERRLGQRGSGGDGRRFSPHVTLGRVRDHASAPAKAALGGAIAARARTFQPGPACRVQEVTVAASVLGPGGPEYSALARVQLPHDRSQLEIPV